MSIKIIRNINQIATLAGAFHKNGRSLEPSDLGVIENGSLVFDSDKIIWCGPDNDLPEEWENQPFKNGEGFVCTPELVDSHTHLVFGGNRSTEYTMRLNGASYEEIALAGGGILNTTEGTQKSSFDQLLATATERVERIRSYGVGTIEIKTGYGLSTSLEKTSVEVISQLKKKFSGKVQIFCTYLAAHAVPKDYTSSSDYLHEVVLPLLEELAPSSSIDAVDIFHEKGYFTEDDVHTLFKKCADLGIPTKIHADEFNDNDGASLAASYGSLSADHLLKTGPMGIKNLSSSNTVATLLPGTGFFLGKDQANGRAFLDAGARVAIASDYNPGSCHWDNLLAISSMAAPVYQMNIAELWSSITLNAAAALGINDQGAISIGLRPRFSFFKVETLDMITYSWGRNYFDLSFSVK